MSGGTRRSIPQPRPGSQIAKASRYFYVRLSTFSPNDSESEIIPVPAFITGLEIVSVHSQDRAIRQVAEGASLYRENLTTTSMEQVEVAASHTM